MRDLELEKHMLTVARVLKARASGWTFDGHLTSIAMQRIRTCTADDPVTRMRIMFTRDVGHHTSGWMRNPDYERCFHLSLSMSPPTIILSAYREQLDKELAARWVRVFFGDDARYTWMESPKSAHGRRADVWHWRLFCDAAWKPILPRGEVYSSEFTEKGWKSFSELGRIIESTVDPT